MREKDSPSLEYNHGNLAAPHGICTSGKLTWDGVASVWHGVVSRLEDSVNDNLVSEDSSRVQMAIQSLRQFAVASTMNKAVVSNSVRLRPRLIELLNRFRWWSHREAKVCVDLCGLINSLVRDCAPLSEHILSQPSILDQMMQVVLDDNSESRLREITLLLLRSLFGAEELSSVLCSPKPIPSQKSAALTLFTDAVLRRLLTFVRSEDCLSCTRSNSARQPSDPSFCKLTSSARCWLMELLSLLATDFSLAVRLLRLGVLDVCHQVIMSTSCRHSNPLNAPYVSGKTPFNLHMNPVACSRATDPANLLAARFALKLLAHLLFYVNDALKEFKSVYGETDPFKLIACYSHLTGSVPPSIPRICHIFPPGYRSKRTRGPFSLETSTRSDSQDCVFPDEETFPTDSSNFMHRSVPVCSRVPSARGTQALLGIVRGLLYWRLVSLECRRNVEAVDQFGNHVASATGLGMSSDDVALLVIQPLTEGCLHVEDTRIFAWICHVLVLVLDQRVELHQWTVYTNSFVREMDVRVTALIKAVQAALDGKNHVQFIEHLIPMVKLFACLASQSESIRALFSELTLSGKLIDFALHMKSLGTEHANLVLEFQCSMAVFLHVLSRSFSAHHSFFRKEGCNRYLLQLINDNLHEACNGHSLCANVVEAASSALVNVLLPQSPLRQQESNPLIESCICVLIRLITSSSSVRSTNLPDLMDISSPTDAPIETTPELRIHHTLSESELRTTLLRLRLNGIWGLVNLLHGASVVACTQLFERLISDGVWLDLLRPLILNTQSSSVWTKQQTIPTPTARRCSTGSVHRPEFKRSKVRTRSMVVPEYSSIRDPMFFPPLSVTPPDEADEAIVVSATTMSRVSSEKRISSTAPGDNDLPSNHEADAKLHHLLLHKTLMFLHNLLRHEKVIDLVVKDHWWNVTQLLVSVLEGNYPQPIKEQAVLVLAHLANGRSARKELHRNEDMIEKLKLFMRSPDSHIKAAALTATYNLLGLGRDHSDFGLFGSSRTHSDPFLSHQWRLYHRHKDRHRRKTETHNRPPSATSGTSLRRDAATYVAHSALEEATEELEEGEEQDIVLEHAVIAEEGTSQIHGGRDSISHRALQTDEILADPPVAVQDSAVSFSIQRPASPSDQNLLTTNRRRPYQQHAYRHWWYLSPSSGTQSQTLESNSFHRNTRSATSRSAIADAVMCSLSASSSSSSTSSTSCAEDLASTVVQVAELDPASTQVTGAISSTSCSEAELNVTSPSIDPQVHDDTLSESLALDAHAPLASQEGGDDTESLAVSSRHSYFTDTASQTVAEIAPATPSNRSSHANYNRREGDMNNRKESSGSLSSRLQPWSTSIRQQFVCPRRSRRDLETGFRQILLPFLQELESDQLLRNTWDWLMLRANTRGKPVQLHHLFVAWQRLYNTLPSGSSTHTISDTLNIESNLFSNCVTVDAFLRRLKESSNPTCSSSLLAALPRHRDGRHRRRHHNCRRHQAHAQNQHTATTRSESSATTIEAASNSASIPPVATFEELEHTDQLPSDNTGHHT